MTENVKRDVSKEGEIRNLRLNIVSVAPMNKIEYMKNLLPNCSGMVSTV